MLLMEAQRNSAWASSGKWSHWPLIVISLLLLGACSKEVPRSLGTLEWDRITLPSPAAERITAIDVREGQRVKAGDTLLQLEISHTGAQLAALQAQARQGSAALAELRAGPRKEDIAQAEASLAAARAQATEATTSYNRIRELGGRNLVSAAEVDRARADAQSADAEVRVAQQALLQRQRGTRKEQIAQGEAALQAASAQATAQQVSLSRLTLVAPRDAQVDSIPYRLGDQAPVGAPLVVLLAGDAPFARVYVPAALRAQVKVGDAARVHVQGSEMVWQGRVRMMRNDPTFTPYYALTGQDAERLSYLAEVQLDASAAELPAGLPLWVEFGP
ncbi:MAG: HlyD family efflux transporter periplasmic adaptor subunit [Pseudomonadota bacterium]